MNNAPDISGKWLTHRGAFSQMGKENSREYAKLAASGGRAHEGLLHLEALYNFSSLYLSAAHAAGLERFWNLGNIAYSTEFYLFDDPSEIGPAAQGLAGASKKRVKAARAKATISLRAKWHSTTGEYYRSSTFDVHRRGNDYAGWVELYDLEKFAVRKIEINEVYDYAERVERRVQVAYKTWSDAEYRKPAEYRSGFFPQERYRAKVMYSAHLLQDQRLPLEVLFAVHCRINDFTKANELLADLPAATKLEDFNWQHMHELYT